MIPGIFEKILKAVFLFVIFFIVAVFGIALFNPLLPNPRDMADEQLAKSTLRSMLTACETYATSHKGKYPKSIQDLLAPSDPPAYLNTDYCREGTSGYRFQCEFSDAGYGFTAISIDRPDHRVNKLFTVKTGGLLSWKGGNGV